MAEATEHPAGGETTSTPGGGAGAWPAEGAGVAPPAGAAPEVYRPLSLLAVVGFVLAALYAAVVVVGGVTALFARSPWLLPAWTFLVPCAAALVSWIAQARIRGSEGTQGGQALASWGVGLSLSVGVLYAAYFASTYFAVRQQATDFALQWLTLVEEGKTEKAFRLTIPAERRPADDDKLRGSLEMRFNKPGSASEGGGEFSRFSRMELVRELALAGPNRTEVRPLGVSGWGHEQDGYKVRLKYRVTTPRVAFDLLLTLVSSEGKAKGTRGRQWHVVAKETNLLPEPPPEVTEEGMVLREAGQDAKKFVQSAWMEQVAVGDLEGGYLLTLPPSERGPQRAAGRLYERLALAVGPFPPAQVGPAARAWVDGLRAYAAGDLVRADAPKFWALKVKKEPPAQDLDYGPEIIAGVRNLFRRGPGLVPRMTLARDPPEFTTREGRQRIHFDVSIMLGDPVQRAPKYVAEGQIVVEATGANPRSLDGWRVVRLDLLRGHTAPQMPAPPPQPGGPGAGGRPGGPPGGPARGRP